MRHYGQNLSEYSLALGLIALISIAALTLLGTNLNTIFSGAIQQNTPPTPQPNTPSIKTFPQTATVPNAPYPNLPGKMVILDLGNGQSLTLNMANPVTVADTVGGNGVTENALAVLQQVIDQLKEQGEDPTKIAALEKLAQKGQAIKYLQKTIEAKFPVNGFTDNKEKFIFMTDPANTLVVDGQEVTLLKAASLLNYSLFTYDPNYRYDPADTEAIEKNYRIYDDSSSYTNSADMVNIFNRMIANYQPDSHINGPLDDFMVQLKNVENSGLLSNPVLKSLIMDDLSSQIFVSSTQTYQAPTKAEVGSLVQRTRINSNDICTLSRSASCQDRST